MSNVVDSITRQTIADKINEVTDLGHLKATDIVNQIVDEITGALNRGEDVLVSGFGKFEVLHKEARDGRNPQTGESVKIAARNVVKFRAAAALKQYLTDIALKS